MSDGYQYINIVGKKSQELYQSQPVLSTFRDPAYSHAHFALKLLQIRPGFEQNQRTLLEIVRRGPHRKLT